MATLRQIRECLTKFAAGICAILPNDKFIALFFYALWLAGCTADLIRSQTFAARVGLTIAEVVTILCVAQIGSRLFYPQETELRTQSIPPRLPARILRVRTNLMLGSVSMFVCGVGGLLGRLDVGYPILLGLIAIPYALTDLLGNQDPEYVNSSIKDDNIYVVLSQLSTLQSSHWGEPRVHG